MYYRAIEGSVSGLWVLDLRTKVCYLSNRYYTMLGYVPVEFEGTLVYRNEDGELIKFIGWNIDITQVFLNLIHNASDALQSISQKDIWIELTTRKNQAMFIIEDNGVGVNEGDEDKIMLPFFTTKEPGKGTGLGLSVPKSLVQSLNGELQFERHGDRSRFIVILPLEHAAGNRSGP